MIDWLFGKGTRCDWFGCTFPRGMCDTYNPDYSAPIVKEIYQHYHPCKHCGKDCPEPKYVWFTEPRYEELVATLPEDRWLTQRHYELRYFIENGP